MRNAEPRSACPVPRSAFRVPHSLPRSASSLDRAWPHSRSTRATGTVDECAIGAFGAKQPFFARYERQGFDSQIATAVAFDGADMTFLFWDSSPGGSGYDHPVTDSQRCVQPRVDRSTSQTWPSPPFSCASDAPNERTCE